MICPYCKTEVDDSLDVCPVCGLDLSEYHSRKDVCTVCDSYLNPWDTRCNTCLTPLEEMEKYRVLSYMSVEDRITLSHFDFEEKNGYITLKKMNLRGKYIRKHVLPKNVIAIDNEAFTLKDAEYDSVVLNEGLKSIGERAFWKSKNLREIVIPNSVTSIGKEAFRCCLGLRKATLGKGLEELPEYAFCACFFLDGIDLLNVKKLGAYCLEGCTDLVTLTLNKKTESIGESALSRTAIDLREPARF